jgi:Holliday junction resolvase RusA-like endonuclease
VPMPRPRVYGGRAISIASPKARAWKGAVLAAAKETAAACGWTPSHRPLRLELTFVYARPKKHLDKDGMVKDKYHDAHVIARPDIDNLAKLVMDAMNDVIYMDDCQVVYLSATKQYAAENALHAKITEL